MAMTGFNPEAARMSINGIINSYKELRVAMCNDMQTKFVGGMSDKWSCNQAISFFNSFKEADNSLLTSINTIFESVVNSMNSAAQRWAANTNSSWTNVAFSLETSTISVDSIVENIGGIRGIDIENTPAVVAILDVVHSSANQALQNAIRAVENCGFLDASSNQQANLTASLNTISSNINRAVEQFKSDVSKAINETISAYGDTKGAISNAFSAQ